MNESIGAYKRRDKLVEMLCNFLLRHIASKRYSMMIDGAIRLGLETAANTTPDIAKAMLDSHKTKELTCGFCESIHTYDPELMLKHIYGECPKGPNHD